MAFGKIIVGAVLMLMGTFLTMTIIGAVIGLPMIAIGLYLVYKGQKERVKGMVKEAIKEAEKEKKEKSSE